MNMSYCRFQNTYSDLRDCEDAPVELFVEPTRDSTLSDDELEAAVSLVEMCARVLGNVADQAGCSIEDLFGHGAEKKIRQVLSDASSAARVLRRMS